MKDDDIINSMIDYGDDDGDIGNTRFIDTEKIRAAHEESVKKSTDAVINAEHDEDMDVTKVIDTAKLNAGGEDLGDTVVIKKITEPDAKQYRAEDSSEECFTGVEGDDEPDFEEKTAPVKDAAKPKPVTDIIMPGEKPELDFDYDDYSDYDDYDEGPLLPMILGVLKIAAPIAVIVLIVVFVMTSHNSTITRYRDNFSANTERLLDNMGINIHQRQETGDAGTQNESEVSENQNTVSDTAADESVSEEVNVAQEESEYRTYVQSSVIVPFQGASEASFVKYKDGIVCARTNYICYISDKGEKEWEYYLSVTNPVVKAEGDYILIAQENGKKFFLYKDSQQIYEKSSDDNILSCNVSANGDAVLVTERPSYKGAVAVYNKRGDKAFSWSSGGADIISADISDNSRRVAAALVHTEDHVSSSVYIFDINMTDPYAKADFDNSLTYNVEFKGNRLTVFSDNLITGMDDDGDIQFNIGFEGVELVSCKMDDSGNKTALFTQNNIPMINVYNRNGSLRHTIPVLRMPDYMAVENGNVIYNVDRDIILGKPDAKRPYKYTATMDISGLIPINNSSFMLIYSNGIEMVKMGGVFF